ncbi:amino acid permease [Clostridium sp. P21]|uniref:Amino acid permease n=1 Tax=Clostridium muellerianum TaxID=2716538 RepID=A0A7Y0HQC6_9CLOT|nr:basic amino acid/polyamine antiporter [Clostridium muellerianum]NMM64006.1 amino acid permease [Clostridium muellerianum]
MKKEKKLGLTLLLAFGIGSMIGGGIFNSPTDLITKANPKAVLIAWGIGGTGVIFLALIFQLLANRRPELTGGIFTYAKEGFGEFMGFNSAWGYWLNALLGNVAMFILIFKTLNSLVGEMKPLVSFLMASALLWFIHFIQTRGCKSVGIINAIATAGKIVPLLLVIILGITIFKSQVFNVQNWKTVIVSTGDTATVASQVKGAMGTILWCFIGVEAATVLSERAKSQKIVGTATVLSLLVVLLINVLITVAAMGSIPAKVLASSQTPLADVLIRTSIGNIGAIIVKIGLIVALLGNLMSWIMLTAEIAYIAAKGGSMPKWFTKLNSHDAPVNALLITDLVTQIFIFSLFSPALQSAYNTVFLVATTCILVPYLFSSLYAFKVSMQDNLGIKDKIVSLLASVYSVYVIYAVGIKYLGAALIMYAIGVFVYLRARKEQNKPITSKEKISISIVSLLGVLMIVMIVTGKIQL